VEITEINNETLKKIITCKEGEFIFATYDPTKDPEMTSDVIQEVTQYCIDNNCKCLFLPESNDQVAVAFQDMTAEQLRRLEGLIHAEVQKRSKIILTN